MRTQDRPRSLRFVTVLVAAGLLTAGTAFAQHAGGGGHGGGIGASAHFGGDAHAGGFGGAHFGGYGYGRGYYGRAAYGGWYGRGYGYWGGCCGWGWWGPGWFGLGLYATWLPWYYSMYWWDGYPYYYYDNTYYVWNGDVGQYQQVNPPQGFNPGTSSSTPPADASAPGPANNTELFAYPKAGQSPDQQARDRDECSRWAAGQVGQPPAQAPPPGSTPAAGAAGQPANPAAPASTNAAMQHQAYLRAEAACLQARNYTVE